MLAAVTAVVDAGGASRLSTATAALAAYRPALVLITVVAAGGMLVALSSIRPPRRAATQVTARDNLPDEP